MRHIAVCVTGQTNCERLIREGAQLSKINSAELSVLHVARPGAVLLGQQDEGKALEYLFQVSSLFDADMTVLRSDNIADTIVHYAQKNGVDMLVIGQAGKPQKWDISAEIKLKMPELRMQVVYG